MSTMYGKIGIPSKITNFSLKVRIMIDRRHTTTSYHVSNNVIQFPMNRNKIGVSTGTGDLYLQACQQLLRPVKNFFFVEEDDDDGGNGGGGFTVYDLDGYLGELNEIQGRFMDNPHADGQLNAQEKQSLKTDVATLQAAGFEHTNNNHPEVIAAYGDQLIDRHFPPNYAELAENSEISPELKKAYADVKGMVEQAKKAAAATSTPSLHR